MSIKNLIAQLQAKVAPKGKPATKAATVPQHQQAMPQFNQPQPPVGQGHPSYQQQTTPATSAPAAPRKFGTSIGWSDDAAFNSYWSKANYLSNQGAVANLLNAAFSGDPSRVPPEFQGKSPAELVMQAITMVGRDAAIHGSEVAMRQTMQGLQADLPLLESTIGQQFNTRTAEQLISSDQRIAGNENLMNTAKYLMEQARQQDPQASPQDIHEYIKLSFQAMGISAFQPEAPPVPKGQQGRMAQQQQQPTGMPQEVFDSMFGEFLPPPTNTPMNPQGVPNTGMSNNAGDFVNPAAFDFPVASTGGTPPVI